MANTLKNLAPEQKVQLQRQIEKATQAYASLSTDDAEAVTWHIIVIAGPTPCSCRVPIPRASDGGIMRGR
jgi:hypothetical protein